MNECLQSFSFNIGIAFGNEKVLNRFYVFAGDSPSVHTIYMVLLSHFGK